jgi:3',5'-cyclic AMP phosphodiesterase CpdA
MGARFAINHSNLIGYLTADRDARAPRSDRETLGTFLMSLAYNRNLISSTQGTQDDWTERVREAARDRLDRMRFQFGELEPMPPEAVARFLDPLRTYFTGYDFYALVLPTGKWNEDQASFAFFTEAAVSSHTSGLVLMPDEPPYSGLSQFVDPFPALKVLADNPIAPPGVVFWTPLRGTCALPLNDARAFFRGQLLDALEGGLEATDGAIRAQAARQKAKRILHLSDLHIGLQETAQRRSWLKQHLAKVLPSIDRVVVTGDLFDTPKQELRTSFDELRHDVERLTTKSLLVIPGNHDVRVKGNALGVFGRNAKHVVDLEWSPVVVDDDIQTVFFSFNSSEDGDFATGSVNLRQRLDRGTEHDALIEKHPKVRGYFSVALVHHHPVSYSSLPTALYERLLARFVGEEKLIAFNDAKSFLKWCADRGVGLVLHGHKHMPHLATVEVSTANGDRAVTVVGCGSSVGAEGKPMCYDIVTFDPVTGRWSVSFYHDERGDGGGFSLQNVALDMRRI